MNIKAVHLPPLNHVLMFDNPPLPAASPDTGGFAEGASGIPPFKS